MRGPLLRSMLFLLLIAAGFAVTEAVGSGQQTASVTSPTATSAPSPPDVLVVGDSLAVGMRKFLTSDFAPHSVYFDVKSGRTSPQMIDALRIALPLVVGPKVVVVSSGTNDGASPVRFRMRIDKVLSMIPESSCIIWPDIIRPPRKGPYRALNDVLYLEARRDRRLHVAHWLEAVDSGLVKLRDGIHPFVDGFGFRAQMVMDLVDQDCSL